MAIPTVHVDVCGAVDLASDPSQSSGVHVISSATTNTKGTWLQLIAATPYDFELLVLGTKAPGANSFSIDIGIGGAGSEVVLIPDWMVGTGDQAAAHRVQFPVHIPAGTRISARCQSSASSGDLEITVQGFAGNAQGYAGVDCIGFVAATTAGLAVDLAGGTRFLFGSYTELIHTTTKDYAGVMLMMNGASGGGINQSWLWCLAIGASGSEVEIISNVWMNMDNGAGLAFYPFVPLKIPAGTRLSIRQMHEGTSPSTSPTYTLYGFF